MHIDFYYYGLLLLLINLYSPLFCCTCQFVDSHFLLSIRTLNDDVMILFGMRVHCLYIFFPEIQTKKQFETIPEPE